ncbi:MAG: hypothetical protein ACR2M7_03975 [Bdellovibrionales bacterium]
MVVGIIGILAAIGIPAYQSYQDDAKRSVVESFLLTAGRTVDINRSLAKKTYKSDLDAKVQSKGASVGAWDTNPNPISEVSGTGNEWCIQIATSAGPDGCLTSAGQKSFKGNLDCTDYETIDNGGTKECVVSGCTAGGAVGAECSGTVTNTGECSSATACG